MYKRYYDGYGARKAKHDPGEIIIPKSAEDTYSPPVSSEITNRPAECNGQIKTAGHEKNNNPFSFLGETDDLILIGLLLFLLWDADNSDPIMLIIVGFLLFGDMF